MKATLITLAALAVCSVAPITSHASDKEVQSPKAVRHSCKYSDHSTALFVSGHGVGDQAKPRAITLNSAQMGQGTGITFFTGNR